jgi:hypothetical protein
MYKKFSIAILYFVFISSFYHVSYLIAEEPNDSEYFITNIYQHRVSPKDTEKLLRSLTTFRSSIPKFEEEKKPEETKDKDLLKLTPVNYIKLGVENETIENNLSNKESENRAVLNYIDNLTSVKDFYAAYKSSELKYDVVAVQEGINYATLFNTVYIDSKTNKSDKFKRKDKILIFKPMGKISLTHRLYKTAGVCEIQDIIKKSHWSKNFILITKVIESYEPIEVGFKAMDYNPPDIKYVTDVKGYTSNINGKIVRLTGEQRFAGAGYMCIINLGRSNKIKTGDVLDIVRMKKGPGFSIPNKLGEAQVIHTTEDYATTIILTSDIEITPGDLVTLSKVAVYK